MNSEAPRKINSRNSTAKTALVLLRVTLGALFVSVFFENLNKGLYGPSGYAGLINYYIDKGKAPQALKSLMSVMAAHASVAGPLQGVTEVSFGILLILGILTRAVGLASFVFLTTLWVSEWGTAWIWELLVPMSVALALIFGRAGRKWGIDAALARKYPSSPLW